VSRVLLTGGAGFIGGVVARQLRARGDTVVGVVRDPSRATALSEIGAGLVAGDLGSVGAIAAAMDGVDAVIHAAGQYRVGILASERPAMLDANEGTTRRVLEGAVRAGVPRTVVVSTVNVFGDTRGQTVDETYRRDLARGFLSYYDESKYRSHMAAEAAIAAGQSVVIVQPSQVYGAGDHSAFGAQLAQAAAGTLQYRALESLGLCVVHVEDLAAGIVAALDRGRLGEAYVLAGPALRMKEAIAAAEAAHALAAAGGGTALRAGGRGRVPAECAGGPVSIRWRHVLGDGRQGGAGARVPVAVRGGRVRRGVRQPLTHGGTDERGSPGSAGVVAGTVTRWRSTSGRPRAPTRQAAPP